MLELNKVHNVDCIVGLNSIQDHTVDLIVTSPPYNVGIEYDSYNDVIPWDQYYGWCENWLKELYRVLKPDGRFCLNHYISFGSSKWREVPLMRLNNICENIGFKHHSLALWWDEHRCKYSAWGSWKSASSPYINQPIEGVLILYKDRWKRDNKGEDTISKDDFIMGCSGIWKINPVHGGDTPANYPERLPKLCIELLSFKDDIVLDPFAGSGTTGVAALKTERRFIGFEISPAYCEIANSNLKVWKEQRRL